MGLDIRVPVGGMFALLGALLAGYGLFGGPTLSQRSLGIDIDLWWGGVLLVFGALMLALAWWVSRKAANSEAGCRASGRDPRTAAGSLRPATTKPEVAPGNGAPPPGKASATRPTASPARGD